MSDHLTAVSRKRIGSGIRVMIAGVLLASSAVVIAPVTVSALGPPPCAIESYNSGTDPIEISTPGHLGSLSATPADWNKNFIQTADIVFPACNWTPIGYYDNGANLGVPFTGRFDGGGKQIRNLTRDNSSTSRGGLFGLTQGATLSSITLIDVKMNLQNDSGGLVGEAIDTVISGSSVTGDVTGGGRVGGLVGVARSGRISDSWSSANVTGSASVGGLIGNATRNFDVAGSLGTIISNSFATGSVRGTGNEVGGLAGIAWGPITNSYATGSVTATNGDRVGGLVGEAKGTVSASYATGAVNGVKDQIGGLVGLADGALIAESWASGAVEGRGQVGGLVGRAISGALIRDSYSLGAVDGSIGGGGATGGLVGQLLGDSNTIERAYSVGRVTGTNPGGLVGQNGGSTVSASYWDVTTSAQAASAGGVGQPTEEMKVIDAFTSASWDIGTSWLASKVWGICDTVNGGYPYLTWQFPGGVGLATSCGGTGSGSNTNLDSNTNPTTDPPASTQEEVPLVSDVTPPVPVLVDGMLPQLSPGDVVVYEDGVPVAVQIYVEDDTELVIEASTFELRLSGECDSGCTITESDAGEQVLTLEEDGSARTEGLGFLPGSKVDIWMFSEPRYLGQLTVAADGTFLGSVELAGIAVGEHTLQVNGLSMSGAQRSANLGVVVNPVPELMPVSSVLPRTGASATALWWEALGLMGAGAVALGWRRFRLTAVSRRM
jgi:hypothetical protein